LCNAWRCTCIDPSVGNQQQTNSYWECIHEQYLIHSKNPRSQISLQHNSQLSTPYRISKMVLLLSSSRPSQSKCD
jgi:hypothetical protein